MRKFASLEEALTAEYTIGGDLSLQLAPNTDIGLFLEDIKFDYGAVEGDVDEADEHYAQAGWAELSEEEINLLLANTSAWDWDEDLFLEAVNGALSGFQVSADEIIGPGNAEPSGDADEITFPEYGDFTVLRGEWGVWETAKHPLEELLTQGKVVYKWNQAAVDEVETNAVRSDDALE